MIEISELRGLPIAQRLELLADLWDSIAEDQNAVSDPPAVVAELKERRARFLSDPSSAVPWEEAKARIRAGRE